MEKNDLKRLIRNNRGKVVILKKDYENIYFAIFIDKKGKKTFKNNIDEVIKKVDYKILKDEFSLVDVVEVDSKLLEVLENEWSKQVHYHFKRIFRNKWI